MCACGGARPTNQTSAELAATQAEEAERRLQAIRDTAQANQDAQANALANSAS